MKTSFFLYPFSRCLSKETLDMLIVAKHRLSEKKKDDAMNHLQGCPKCRVRCLSRVAFLEGCDQVGILQPEGFHSAGNNSRHPTAAFLPGLGASVAAVGILGVALLSPLFIRASAQGGNRETMQPYAVDSSARERQHQKTKQHKQGQNEGLKERLQKIEALLRREEAKRKPQPGDDVNDKDVYNATRVKELRDWQFVLRRAIGTPTKARDKGRGELHKQ